MIVFRWIKNLFFILFWLYLFNIVFFIFLSQYRFKYIVIHHTATKKGNYEIISSVHKRRGWKDAAYHLILNNGSTKIPAGYLEATNRYKYFFPSGATKSIWCNINCIHLAVVGDFENEQMSEKTQIALVSAIQQLQQKFHIIPRGVILHRNCNDTLCPGKHVTKEKIFSWINKWKNKIPYEIASQHKKVLNKAWFSSDSIKQFLPHFLIFNIIVLSFMALIYLFFKLVFVSVKSGKISTS